MNTPAATDLTPTAAPNPTANQVPTPADPGEPRVGDRDMPSGDDPHARSLVDRPPQNERLTTIQPGGGVVMSLELAWGRWRRGFLRTFRPGYVRQMADKRRGQRGSLPFDPIDPRDVKYYANQETFYWDASDDPFIWRDRLPFVRMGLAELTLMGGGAFLAALILGWIWWPLAIGPLVVAGLIVWFFRDPPRTIPQQPGVVVSPADGKLVLIEPFDDPQLGRCLRFGIFLSIFNVHANRAAIAGRVLRTDYRPGKMLNALRDESVRENENLDLIVQPDESTDRPYRIRQITGQFARRIVCRAKAGDVLRRGQMYGMIKLGSRTELIIPDDGDVQAVAAIGDKVSAGSTVMARYRSPTHPTGGSA